MPSLLQFLEAVAEVPPEFMRHVEAQARQVTLRKGDTLIKAGEVATSLGFLEEGLVKLHGQDNRGTPFVVEFAGAGEFVSDYSAMVQGLPVNLTIEALEDCVVSAFPFAEYQRLVNEVQVLHKLARKILEDLVIKLSGREFQFLTMDAKERYLHFMDKRRDIAGRISRNDLAAYLGITPVSLSRIRAQVIRERRSQAT